MSWQQQNGNTYALSAAKAAQPFFLMPPTLLRETSRGVSGAFDSSIMKMLKI